MAKSREIKRRIKAVGNIRRITRTMQMIATARFQAAQRRATASQPYTRRIAALVGELAAVAAAGGGEGSARGLNHPLLRSSERAGGRELLLVITSNRGLAGAYNGNILRAAVVLLREHEGRAIDLELVGKKGLAFFRFLGRPVQAFHSQIGDTPTFDQVERLAEQYMSAFSEGRYDAVRVCFMAFESMSRQSPRVLKLLPLENPAAAGAPAGTTGTAADPSARAGGAPSGGGGAAVEYDFSPDPEQLLNELLPITVKTQLFQCFNEAVVSEQIARMVAMKAATDSAGKMGKDLSRRYNRARQAAITTELSEIIAGAASLG